jgi:FkbM family methyltransferase
MKKFAQYYSQNFEDVLLARIFADIPTGFYVDAGCQDEKNDSVTKFFYEKGWTGINIDPVKEYIEQYNSRRPKDTNLCCAVGASDGSAQFYAVFDSGLSSLDKSRAELAIGLGLEAAPPTIVQVRTLNSILDENLPLDSEISFLKIDVEGYELEALKGLSLKKHRPKIILAETTKPCTIDLVDNYAEMNQLLLENSYTRIYFDGINTWWIAAEEGWRKKFFDYPVGFFDGFKPLDIREEIQRLEIEITDLKASLLNYQRPSFFDKLRKRLTS